MFEFLVLYAQCLQSAKDTCRFRSRVWCLLKMQTIKVENPGCGSYNNTPEKKAQNREKQLLTFVVRATARDQEKNILISKLQREMSEAVEDFEALQTEVKLKDKFLQAKEDELLVVKHENEALKQQLEFLMSKKKKSGVKTNDDKASLKPESADLKRHNSDAGSPSTSPRNTPALSRKRSIKKTKDTNVATNLFYNLRKKSKK